MRTVIFGGEADQTRPLLGALSKQIVEDSLIDAGSAVTEDLAESGHVYGSPAIAHSRVDKYGDIVLLHKNKMYET